MHRRVMVVEDDTDIRESLIDFLEESGMSAIGAVNGRDALEKLGQAPSLPCLILLDLMMPVLDGRGFRALQVEDPALSGIPVVVISAYRDVEKLAGELNPEGVLRKPLQLDALRGYVDRFCGTTMAGPPPGGLSG